MTVEIANESGVTVDEASIASAAQYALDTLRVSPQAELSVLLVAPEVMAELHERWMDEPGPTDVMAFPMDEIVEDTRRPDAPDIGPALLGDVVLCPEFARSQARTAGHTLADELHLLTVHGVLHLLGNLLFFYCFSRSIETQITIVGYLLSFVVFVLATNITFALTATSQIPTVGLSGVVWGYMGMFLFRYPRDNINCFVWFIWIFKTIEVPVLLFVLVIPILVLNIRRFRREA